MSYCVLLQHEQEEEFDLMEDAFLLADDPNMPGGGGGAGDEQALGPADGLGLDSFIEGETEHIMQAIF